MNSTEIPLVNLLLKLFKSLREEYHFPLGVDDYLLALEALQAGFGIGDPQALEFLCCTLWAKSPKDAKTLHEQLNKLLKKAQIETEKSFTIDNSTINNNESIIDAFLPEAPLVEPELPVDSSTVPPIPETSSTSKFGEFGNQGTLSSSTEPPLELKEPQKVIQAIRQHEPNLRIKIYPRQDPTKEYLPVTSRHIIQSWRLLRHLVRKGTLDKLDTVGTIDEVSRQGVLLDAMMMPRYVNQALLILLVDQDGSMVPFHHLYRQLIDKAQHGGNINKTLIYYFHNYPEKYLYGDSTRIKGNLIKEVLESFDDKAAVLIISDAGAARGYYNEERVEGTKKFIEQLQKSVRYFAWLNPVPDDSWQNTSAEEIASFVPMFEMSRDGLIAAIDILRGRYVFCPDQSTSS
ncbi:MULTISPECIES: hypothetical protein [Calothrix]|uniref:VWA containing CoxE family protein n=2 Tax=Calothrix TaxID=1186 RepID=A0ABR8AHK0_9CYAN|nr:MULTISPECIES: hypothetical protein [Calothrix]MBD2199428.1 hypothetical protein [Calothrix parietina FACHB-288]MBD2228229.1 hypothetical protein [Calothrix anomala FACHB-343]